MSCFAANTGAVTVFVCATGLSKWSVPAKGTYEVFEQVEAGQTVAYSVQVSGAAAAANKQRAAKGLCCSLQHRGC